MCHFAEINNLYVECILIGFERLNFFGELILTCDRFGLVHQPRTRKELTAYKPDEILTTYPTKFLSKTNNCLLGGVVLP